MPGDPREIVNSTSNHYDSPMDYEEMVYSHNIDDVEDEDNVRGYKMFVISE